MSEKRSSTMSQKTDSNIDNGRNRLRGIQFEGFYEYAEKCFPGDEILLIIFGELKKKEMKTTRSLRQSLSTVPTI